MPRPLHVSLGYPEHFQGVVVVMEVVNIRVIHLQASLTLAAHVGDKLFLSAARKLSHLN